MMVIIDDGDGEEGQQQEHRTVMRMMEENEAWAGLC